MSPTAHKWYPFPFPKLIQPAFWKYAKLPKRTAASQADLGYTNFSIRPDSNRHTEGNAPFQDQTLHPLPRPCCEREEVQIRGIPNNNRQRTRKIPRKAKALLEMVKPRKDNAQPEQKKLSAPDELFSSRIAAWGHHDDTWEVRPSAKEASTGRVEPIATSETPQEDFHHFFPANFPDLHRHIHAVQDLASYVTKSSYVVGVGVGVGTAADPPDAQLVSQRYGIIIVPAGHEESLFSRSNRMYPFSHHQPLGEYSQPNPRTTEEIANASPAPPPPSQPRYIFGNVFGNLTRTSVPENDPVVEHTRTNNITTKESSLQSQPNPFTPNIFTNIFAGTAGIATTSGRELKQEQQGA
ncbi:hypothetical protein B0H66DRAFT_534772 [Apodospora peruviana]|uniref:Uncharacterized protein n=1 Tax=Apodospora peruviana TaxID=516989 RepID=A0AAE0I121_9PEZI|nr:hypothetical protein B0H66DRAFT_534772 [Apodospora peruviana]